MLAVGDELDYPFSLERESMFSAVLVWHRHVDDAIQSHLPDYELSVYDAGGARVAHSDSSANNVELVESRLQAGGYLMKVRVKSDGGSTDELSYGLAWTAKEVLARPANVGARASAEHWSVYWDERSDHKYRVRVARDAGFTDIDRDVYVDGTAYPHEIPADGTPRHFRVYAYPGRRKGRVRVPFGACDDPFAGKPVSWTSLATGIILNSIDRRTARIEGHLFGIEISPDRPDGE